MPTAVHRIPIIFFILLYVSKPVLLAAEPTIRNLFAYPINGYSLSLFDQIIFKPTK